MKKTDILVEALNIIKKEQKRNINIFKSSLFERQQKEVLEEYGYIKPIIKGWYYISNPSDMPNDTTSWYMNFWQFLSLYLKDKHKKNYVLGVNESLLLHSKKTVIPTNLSVSLKEGGSQILDLPFGIKVTVFQDPNFKKTDIVENEYGLQIYSIEKTIAKLPPDAYVRNYEDVMILFSLLRDVGKLTQILIEEKRMGSSSGRIIGALQRLGKDTEAQLIHNALERLFTNVPVTDPFEKHVSTFGMNLAKSPYASRVKLLWRENRNIIEDIFGALKPIEYTQLITNVEENYKKDAYNSLSIEGYKVSDELIERVSSGHWLPEENLQDANSKNALAAKGYYLAFQEVLKSIDKMHHNGEAAKTLEKDYQGWYYNLFLPSADARIIEHSQLIGYRRHPVYIRNSAHVPLPEHALLDSMEAFFEMMIEENSASVRAILGHHIFTYIHPYPDGNGRIGRFIMNAMLVSGGLPWSIIEVDKRDVYMKALEDASVTQNIGSFAKFVYEICSHEHRKILTQATNKK